MSLVWGNIPLMLATVVVHGGRSHYAKGDRADLNTLELEATTFLEHKATIRKQW